ncbi:hypothetical protein B0E53_00411 [Micromonospora sp. MH33]|uniref:hypothetical protein n=1 Tax=Micromonospora sp. MH33 TaxID=1945509 RepID=UPI000D14B663|nr:hypothetical protein [Micromonospora sp. MH33]PSK67601.1 hypothetical protein B0E53_00411 [Micromonospora sp. MH33]
MRSPTCLDRALAAAGAAGLATALATTALPTPVRLPGPVLLTSTGSGCDGFAPAPPSDASTTVLAYPRPAASVLRELALHIGAATCDQAQGRFDLVRHRAWQIDGATGQTTTRDVVRWYAEDDSGAEMVNEYSGRWTATAVDWWAPGWLHDQGLQQVFVSADWLRSRVTRQPQQIDPTQQVLVGLAMLATWRSPPRSGRALSLAVLADTPGLLAYPHTVDRAGRGGIGVATTSRDGSERHLLILHPASGEVLAYEHARLTATGWRPDRYLLLLAHSHTARRWWEPPSDGHTTTANRPDQRMQPHHSRRWLLFSTQPCTAHQKVHSPWAGWRPAGPLR